MKRMLFLLCVSSASVFAGWTVLEDCRLTENQANDGDSFVVECSQPYRGEKQNRFRLYFVDTAETDSNSDFKKDRLKEQAKYWGSDDPEFALKMGLRAKQTVQRLLCGGFSVYTQGDYAPSMGTPRYYGLIQVKGQWLDEILVEEGLVRIYGKGSDLPDGLDAKDHWRALYTLERAAKFDRRNGWRGTAELEEKTSDVFQPYDTTTSKTAWIYSIQNGRRVTVLSKGVTVTVVALAEENRVRIRFKKNDKVYEGLCYKRNLEL